MSSVSCDICGAVEPPLYADVCEVNETIRPHLKAWSVTAPPRQFYPTLDAALEAWGITDESEAGQHRCPECRMIVIGRKGHKMSCDYYSRYIAEEQ